MHYRFAPACCALVCGVTADGAASNMLERGSDALRLNDIAVVGTHNSYKLPMPATTMAKLQTTDPAMAVSLDYGHRPLVDPR